MSRACDNFIYGEDPGLCVMCGLRWSAHAEKKRDKKIDRILHLLERMSLQHPNCRCHGEVDCDIHGPRRR